MINRVFQIIQNLATRSQIPIIKDVEAEQNKLNLLRIILGLIVFYRYFIIVSTGLNYYNPGSEIYWGALLLTFTAFFTLGFITPLATFMMLALCNLVDFQYNTCTLGTSILTITLVGFFLLNTGLKYSVDEIIIRHGRKNSLTSFINRVYVVLKFPAAIDIRTIYFILFFGYALISMGAMLIHAQDSYWVSGQTAQVILVNAYLCPLYYLFREPMQNYPEFFHYFSICASIAQSIFQLTMLFMIFSKWGRWFVAAWSLLFFLFSYFFLQLSYLPAVEIVLWCLIVLRFYSEEKIAVLYDDFCNLCKKTILTLSVLDFGKKLNYIPLSVNKELLKKYSLDRIKVQEDIHGIYKEKIYIGYDLYYLTVQKNILLWILFPFFWLGKITGIGYAIYKMVARNRIKYFGTCEVSFVPEPENAVAEKIKSGNFSAIAKRLTAGYTLFMLLLLFDFPPLHNRMASMKYSEYYYNTIYFAGLQLPFVFNKVDLSMADSWYVLYRQPENEPKQMVPFTGMKGEKLCYHKSDIIYFGNSLIYRRFMIGRDVVKELTVDKRINKFIEKIAVYDYNRTNQNGKVKYIFDVYTNHTTDVTLPLDERYKAEKRYSGTFTVNPDKTISYGVE